MRLLFFLRQPLSRNVAAKLKSKKIAASAKKRLTIPTACVIVLMH